MQRGVEPGRHFGDSPAFTDHAQETNIKGVHNAFEFGNSNENHEIYNKNSNGLQLHLVGNDVFGYAHCNKSIVATSLKGETICNNN